MLHTRKLHSFYLLLFITFKQDTQDKFISFTSSTVSSTATLDAFGTKKQQINNSPLSLSITQPQDDKTNERETFSVAPCFSASSLLQRSMDPWPTQEYPRDHVLEVYFLFLSADPTQIRKC